MERGDYVYILTNKTKTTLYVGVTSQLKGRISDHKTKKFNNSFSAKYNVDRLVYYECISDMEEAIMREKQIKAGSRLLKEAFINKMNPGWDDLFEGLED